MSTTVTNTDCRDIVPLLASLAEDDVPAPEPAVARHLAECPACRRHLEVQRNIHGLLRARAVTLQGRAPEALRARLAAPPPRRWSLGGFRMPVAATATLALAGVLVYGATSASSTVLAAQLALDHLKCVRLNASRGVVDASQVAQKWAAEYGWTPQMPSAPRATRATLVGVRRCLYGHGHLAHLLYDVDGRMVSLFVMPREEHPVGDAPTTHAFMGQHAEVWGEGDQSFALVGDVPAERLAGLASEFRAAE